MHKISCKPILLCLILLSGIGIAFWLGTPGGNPRQPVEGGAPQHGQAATPRNASRPHTPDRQAAPAAPDEPSAIQGREISMADVLEEIGDLGIPGNRERAVARMRQLEQADRAAAEARARDQGLPLRIVRPDGTVQELVGFDGDRPIYFTTHNTNAAITTGASSLRETPYSLTASGLTIGMWDGGSGRASHQEFSSGARLTVKDGSAPINHATHVGGTLAAAGVDSGARGMATAALVDSYDWNNDKSEMTSRAAAAPGEPGMIYLSNHSYGYVSGWNRVNGGSPFRVWEWWGDGSSSTSIEQDFGRYNTFTRDSDALAFSAPYYLMFRSAGNDRTDNPSNGQSVALSPGSSTVVSYDSASHPQGDGVYRGGFDTIGFDAIGKNVLTVGSVSDAVSGGVRDPSVAVIASYSAWGPTDDGRIKPDLVANGEDVYSSLNGNDAAYGTFSGTSMAAPNATGTAALLIEEYGRLFPGGAMRSSTLKGLLIHTADDLGNPGPDYKFGWGLINGKAAADLIRDHAANPLKIRMTEALITSTNANVSHEFVWDGVSPVRVTLCWTDPAGSATTTSDLRTPRLRNNLDLRIIGPDGSEHLPYVMPFVGTWTQASMNLPATTGKNNVDNVEQVFIANPPAAGVYRCVITFDGTLANNQQHYSLLVSGSANEQPPPPPLTITGITPDNALPGSITVDLAGTGFKADTAVRLQRAGEADVTATSVQLVGSTLRCQFNLAGVLPGAWDVTATNPDTETFTLPGAFTVIGALWSETFDGTVSGWTSQATTGSNSWSLTTASSHSPPTSFFAPGPATKTTCNLISPLIPIPANATNLQFRFWHSYHLENNRDGGKLEFSLDGGSTWFDVISSGSGAVFASNGYNTTMPSRGGGPPGSLSDFAGQAAWSGNSGGFIETIVNLTDTAKYAGKNLRVRWRLATNNSTASPGWHLDSIALTGGGDFSNQAPVITSAATSSSTETVTEADDSVFYIVRGQDTGLSVAASDDGGEAALTYTWSGSHPAGVPVSFTSNGGNDSKNTVALFEATGDYVLTVTVQDSQGLAVSSRVNVRVLQTASAVSISPTVASLTIGGQQAFSAILQDQFGQPMGNQPSAFTWAASGGGSISSAGLFTAASAGGPYVISATSDDLSGIAAVTINPSSAEVTLTDLQHIYDGEPKAATVTTSPAGLAVSVTYDGSPSAPVAVGSYAVEAVITDPNYQGSASEVLQIQSPSVTLTLNPSPAEGGTVSGSGTFAADSTVPITAIAAENWTFTGWTGTGVTEPASPSTTVIMDTTKTVTATFSPQEQEGKNGYEAWAEAAGLVGTDADMQADPDHDNLGNLLEYALDTNPLAFTTPPTAQIEPDDASPPVDRLTMRFTRPKNLADVTYHVLVSSDLKTWVEVTDITLVDLPDDTIETVVARDFEPAHNGRRFMRLEVRHKP